MPTVEPLPLAGSHRRPRRWQRVALAALALALLLWGFVVVALDPLVRRVVQQRSGRSFDFKALHVGLDAAFHPRVAFEGLTVGNAPWATSREPLIRGAKVVFEFDWEGLRTGLWLIQRVVLEDAEVDLERSADGRRNSRLWNPDASGPARTRVLRVDAQRSRLRYADAATGLQLEIRNVAPAAARPLPGHPGSVLTRRLAFEGRRRGIAFAGSADVGDVLTLQRTGEAFPLQGEIRAEGLRLTASGLATDLLAQARFDTDLQLEVAPQARRRSVPLDALPAPLQATAAGHLKRDADRWTLTALRLRAAHSEAEGALDYRPAADATQRAALNVRLDARRLDLSDFRTAAAAPGGAAAAPVPERVRLDAVDADLALHVGQLLSAGAVLATESRLHARLEAARLRVDLADSRIAGGQGSGVWRVDTAREPVESTLDLRLAGVRLERLPAPGSRRPLPAGRLDGHAVLRAQGRSAAELLASASGTVDATLGGASVSKRLEAELGLDGVGLLRSLIGGSDRVPVRCAELSVAVERGRATVRRLAFDTPRTAVSGSGSIDLVGGTLDLVLAPTSNVDALLALPRDIHVTGPLGAPRWSLQARGTRGATARCGTG